MFRNIQWIYRDFIMQISLVYILFLLPAIIFPKCQEKLDFKT